MSGGVEFAYNNPTKDQVLNSDIIQLGIERAEIVGKDFRRIDDMFKVLRECKTRGKGKLLLTVSGYEDTLDEIFEIPEIRAYLEGLLDRCPYFPYFLHNFDGSRNSILFCLCNVIREAPKDIVTSEDVFWDNLPMDAVSRLKLDVRMPKTTATKIVNGILTYGLSIGDKMKKLEKLAKEVVTFKVAKKDTLPKMKNDTVNQLDAYNLMDMGLWEAFVKGFEIEAVPEKDIIDTINTSNVALDLFENDPDLFSRPVPCMVGENRFKNIFFVKDTGYGEICDKCNSSVVYIIKNDLSTDDLDNKVFLPSKETFVAKRIAPSNDAYHKNTPLPINPDKDKWCCPNCKELHSFKYSKEIGLRY